MTFNAFRSSHTHRPLFHLGDVPIDLTNLIVGLHILSALFFTFAKGWFAANWAGDLIYSAAALQGWRLWTLVTYPFVHEIDLWFAIGLFFFWRFGGDVEGILGTRTFAGFYLALAVIPAMGLFALSPLVGDLALIGEGSVHFAIFVAFALVYPNAAMWFNIPVKWFVIVIVAVQTLQYLGHQSWGGLAGLWLSILTAFVILHREGIRSCHSMTGWVQAKLRGGIPSKPARRSAKPKPKPPPSIASDHRIDAILDKISQSGFQSLTPEEKALLNQTSSKYSNRKRP